MFDFCCMEIVVELLVWNDLVWPPRQNRGKGDGDGNGDGERHSQLRSAVVPILDPERRILTTRVQY